MRQLPNQLLLLLLLCFFGIQSALATHIMGGEITWECQNNGQYVFTLKVYRDCNGVTFNSNNHALEVHNYPATGVISQIPLNFFSVTDITPSCEGSPCSTLSQSDPDIPGAIEEYILVSNPITLNGIPGNQGWIFTWTYGDRNAAIDNIVNAQNYGITLRAKMFSYNGQNANPCFDASPDFFQKPSSIICAGEKFTYNHSAFDRELDSLSYEWANPLDGNFCNNPPCTIGSLFQEGNNPVTVPFDAGNNYSYDSPYPDVNLDARNVPAVLDPNTGEITFTSFNTGEFVSIIRVSAFKCGEKVAEIYRELQTVITTGCSSNEPPVIPSPFANGTYNDTVKAGDLVSFDIHVFDSLRSDNPKDDSIFFYATGLQFGNNHIDPNNGCLNPPCATLSSPAPDTGYKSYSTTFNWQTSCTHIANNTPNCISSENTYLFVIRAFDDFCPAAGQAIATFSITVLADSIMEHPEIHCADVQANGDVIIDWNQSPDPDNSFIQWKIYSSTNRSGPYTLIDSIGNYATTSYTHNGAGANNQSIHYIVRAESGCSGGWFLMSPDTISSMYIAPTFNNQCVNVSWNTLDTPLPAGSAANYEVYREYPIGSGFTLYTQTSSTSFCDSFPVCTDSVTYRIQLANTGNGCSGSSSNINGIRFQYPLPTADAGNNQTICTGQSVTIGGSPSGLALASFLWSPADSINNVALSNPEVNPIQTSTYYLNITDTNNCSALDSVLITVQPSPTANAGLNDTICRENFPINLNGSVSISNTGQWIGGSGVFSPNRNTLNASYTPSATEISMGVVDLALVSTNIGICDPDTASVSFLFPALNLPYSLNISNVSCNGLSDGTAKIVLSGSNAPYSYQWNTNNGLQSGDSVSGLSAGTYTLTISNGFGCDSISTFSITQPTVLTASSSVQADVSCNGLSDGKAYITPSGGTAPYTYLWSNSQTTDTSFNLVAGTYTVTLSDNNGCSLSQTVNISEPTTLTTAAAANNRDASCFGASDGWATVAVNGGTAPYTYLWSDNQVTDTAFNLAAGTYTVTVSDNNSCSSSLAATINQPTLLTASSSVQADVSCNGLSDGKAYITPSGGTAPYTYLWSNSQTTDTSFNLAAGTYTVTLSDNNGCSLSQTVNISEPTTLTTAAAANNRDASCFGASDGWATVAVNGGTAPYTYLWSDNQVTDTAFNLAAGTYTVTVSDNNSCSSSLAATINQPTLLTASSSVQADVSCNGLSDGKAYITPSGGTAPYTYLWSNSQTTDTSFNLAAGTYTVTLSDNNGCSLSQTVNISEPTTLTTAAAANNRDASCFGASDGWATVAVNGGTAPYTYLWSDNQVTDTAFNLAAGTYTVTVSDNNSCSSSLAATINQPTLLTASSSVQADVSCNGLSDGKAYITPSGGTAPYTYLWSNSQTTDTSFNLVAGTYTVTLSDNNGCSLSQTVNISEPTTLTTAAAANNRDASCFGASDGWATVAVNGGTAPYTYLWSDNQVTDTAFNLAAGTYTVTVSDNNSCSSSLAATINQPTLLTASSSVQADVSCNGLSDGKAYITPSGGTAPYTYLWSNSQTTDTSFNLAAGTYTVTLSDNNGCSLSQTVNISEPTTLTTAAAANNRDASCFGASDGWATVAVNGGTAPYTYLWSDNQVTDTAFNLAAGTYTVTVSDNNGCSSSLAATINQPTLLTASSSVQADVSCNGLSDGKAYITPSGGTAPYTYLWSNSQTTDTSFNLAACTYTVTLSDNNGCSLSQTVNISEPTTLTTAAAANNRDASCFGASDGWATVAVNGGTAPYTYLWSDNQVTDTAFNLAAGTYTVTVTDQNNCTSAETATINQPMTLTAVLSTAANVSCTGFSDGKAFATPSGGTAPYTYLWNTNSSNDTITSLSAGKYFISISDAQGCQYIDSIAITEPQQLVVAFSSSDDVSCFGKNDGLAIASGTGGTLPYSFFWNNNIFTANNSNLSAGRYMVTITDKNGCTDSSSTRIGQPAPLQTIVHIEDISCFGFNDGVAVARSQGGNTPYTYTWSNNGSMDSLFSLQAGSYKVTVSDANNCTDTSSGKISEPSPLSITVSNNDTICVNTSKTLIASAAGGNGGYQFTWSDNLGASPVIAVSPKQNKTYTVRVTDQNNCPQKSASVTLGVRNIFDDQLDLSATNNICLGDSTTLQYNFQGDYPSYTFTYNHGLGPQNPQFVKPGNTTRYILTVTDICNNQLRDTVVVEVYKRPVISMNDTLIEGCEDLQVSFFNNTPTDYTYAWNFGDGSTSTNARPIHLYTEPGQYNVTLSVTSREGCESQFSGSHRVLVHPTPEASIQADPTVTSIENALIHFMGDFSDANFWRWDFGNGVLSQSIDTSITYADTGTYMVSLFKENIFGCRDSILQAIRIEPSYQIKIPNVFVPNTGGPTGGSYDPNDGSSGNANTVFHPFIEYTKRYHLMIFNRWGELVFESKDVNIGWDGYYKGKLSQADVYVYKLEVTFVNGSKATKVGDVTLLR